MLAHAASGIRLNHRSDARRLKDAFRNIGLSLIAIRPDNNQLALRHVLNIRLGHQLAKIGGISTSPSMRRPVSVKPFLSSFFFFHSRTSRQDRLAATIV